MNAFVKASLIPGHLTTPMAMDGMLCIGAGNIAISSFISGPAALSAFDASPLKPCLPANNAFRCSRIHFPNGKCAVERNIDMLLDSDVRYFSYAHPLPPDFKPSEKLMHLLQSPELPLEPHLRMTALEMGGDVIDDSRFGNGFMLNTYLKSGYETRFGYPVSESIYNAYQEWKSVMGFNTEGHKSIPDLTELAYFLLPYGIALEYDNEHSLVTIGPDHINYMLAILKRLPPAFLNNPYYLCKIIIGANRSGAAKGSAFDKGDVRLYSRQFNGSRRNFLGFFLHEMGHSTAACYVLNAKENEGMNPDETIPLEIRQQMHADFNIIRGINFATNQIYALDWANEYQSRLWYAFSSFDEFIAELHMIYVVDGPGLRDHILSIDNKEQQDAYLRIYFEIQDRVFGGVEYDLFGRPCTVFGEPIQSLHPHAP